MRQVRRRLIDLYSVHWLASAAEEQAAADGDVASTFALVVAAVPPAPALKDMIVHFFDQFLDRRVEALIDIQLQLSGQGLRTDGNIKLARRIRRKSGARWFKPYNCLLAWCGTDGALLQPVSTCASESFEAIQADLTALLDRMRRVRGKRGLSVAPAFHSTVPWCDWHSFFWVLGAYYTPLAFGRAGDLLNVPLIVKPTLGLSQIRESRHYLARAQIHPY